MVLKLARFNNLYFVKSNHYSINKQVSVGREVELQIKEDK